MTVIAELLPRILRRAGEIVAGCALIVVGGVAVGLATLL